MSTEHTPTQTTHAQHGLYPQAQSVEQLKQNIALIQARIAAACERVGRDPASVRLLPVSKTKDAAVLRLAYQAGCRWFGENKVQEAQQKSVELADLSDVSWSVLGNLQTNKARYVARFAAEFQALDRLRIAEVLNQRLQIEQRQLDVFVQVNTSGEASKYGIEPEQTLDFVQQLHQFPHLKVKGLMTLALFSAEAAKVRACFVRLRELRDQLNQHFPTEQQVHELSMGMSGDFEIAIEEGATVVRVGQAIFGARDTPDSAYWPS